MRTITRYILLTLVILCNASLYAQTTIQGRITYEKDEPASYISVLLRQLPDSTITDYGYSDDNGNYKLTYNGDAKKLLVSVSGMDVAPQDRQIDNRSQTLDFRVIEQAIELKEVVIQSTKIWGGKDTVNYLVSAFSDRNDIVIGDVLKKMPGINLDESGQISYQGKPINKFYIENMDMLQGRYGIATNNISAREVATVQVLENHQPIKALDNVRISDNAAINLRLKEGAKGTLSIMPQLGLGASPLLWDNELTGMYFARKHQNITTYKGNNAGNDLSRELRSFTTGNAFGNENMLAVTMSSPPAIDKSRYLFNNSNAATVNNLIKTKENSELNLNLIYLNDHENRRSNARTTYYIPGQDVLVIDEAMASATNTDRLEGEFRYNLNDVNNYLNNYLNVEGLWESNLGNIQAEEYLSQRLKKPSFRINNAFHWVKKTGSEKGFELSSNTGFKSAPQTLSVRPGQYPEIFNDGEQYAMLRQKARINSFYLNNRMTILSPLMTGNVRIDPNLEFNIESRNLDSDIFKQAADGHLTPYTAESMRNDLGWLKYTAGLGLNVKYYAVRNLKIDLSLPVYYHGIHLNNKIEANKNTISRTFFQPAVNLSYEFNPRLKLSGGYRLYNQLGDIQTLYTGYILENYRSLNHYDGNLMEAKGHGGNLSIAYKELISMLFAGVDINYNHLRRNMLYGQSFDGILSITSAIEQNNSIENISLSGRISKGFDWKNAVLGVEAAYGLYTSQQLRQSSLVDYKMNMLNITASLNGKPTSFLVFSYKGTWGRSTSRIGKGETSPAIRSLVNHASLDVHLPKGFSLNLNFEHYYNSASLGDKNLSFADLGIKYTWKRMDYRLTWNNIFDTDNYISAYYGDMNAYQHIYHIRPTNVMLKVRFKLK